MGYKAAVHRQIAQGLAAVFVLGALLFTLPPSFLETARTRLIAISLLVAAQPLFAASASVVLLRYSDEDLILGWKSGKAPACSKPSCRTPWNRPW